MYIRKTFRSDIDSFSPHKDDIAEAKAYGIEPSFPDDLSDCVTLSHSGFPIAIGGNCGDQVWFVTSRYVEFLTRRQRRDFFKCIVEYRDKMLASYPVLWNYVWIGNKSHIRFLKAIGAVFEDTFTADGQFQLFTIRR